MADNPEHSKLLEALVSLSQAQTEGPHSEFASLASLASILSGQHTPKIQNRWFKNETVHIDGYDFEDCRFDGCQLVTEMATFVFRRCFIAPNCRIYFRGAALKTVRLLMHVLRLQDRIEVRADERGIYATLNADGTFTLE